MIIRRLSVVVGLALVAAGCGGSAQPPRSGGVHLDGRRAPSDYVFETDSSGARFLVPALVLAGQRGQTFQVAAPARPTVGAPSPAVTGPPPGYRFGVASDTAVVPHSAHVEILATGDPGNRFALSWTETCGWTQHGRAAEGGTGGQGMEVLRTPAVTLVKLPRIHHGVGLCYLGATASARTFTRRLRLMIIDY
jgi:hypothetical protein